MSVRVLSFSAFAALLATSALAADTGAPVQKPSLNRAPLNLNDGLKGTTIRGQVPVSATSSA